MNRHILKRVTAVLLATVMSASLCISGFATAGEDEFEENEIETYAASDTESITFSANYKQTNARDTLQYVNDFRASDTGYWTKDGEWKDAGVLSALNYDYALEEVAMQRAAEIAVYFDHTRPDGTKVSNLASEMGYSGTIGENIGYAYGSKYSDPATVVEWFEENDEDYSGQGHRRILLSENYNYTNYACACVNLNGYYYWVMLLSIPSSGANTSAVTSALDSSKDVTLNVKDEYVTVNSVNCDTDTISFTHGERTSDTLPSVTASIKCGNSSVNCSVSPVWESSDTSVVQIDNEHNAMTYINSGTATVSADVLGETVSFSVIIAYEAEEVTHVPYKAPSCTEDGNIEYWTVDGKYFEDEALTEEISYTDTIIPATGHTFSGNVDEIEFIFDGDPNVNGTPVSGSYVCTVCGAKVSISGTITHSDSDCTCTTEGTRTYSITFEINGEFYNLTWNDTAPALGHELIATFNWYEENGEAKCIAHITCERGDVDEYLDCLVTEVSHTDADCTTNGETTFKASITYDGQTFDAPENYTIVTQEALGHELVYVSAKDATCTEDGNNAYYYCERCGKCFADANAEAEITRDEIIIPALGHEFITVPQQEPTCTEDGYTAYTVCERCGERLTEPTVIPALGHNYELLEFVWDGYESCSATFVCTRGDDTQTVPCTITSDVTKQADCDNAGEITYTATVTFDDVSYSDTKTETSAPTGDHTWDSGKIVKEPTCTEDGERLYTCTKCGLTYTEVIPATGHTYSDTSVAATCTEDGYTEHVCTKCGYSYIDDYVAALGHDYQTQFNWASDYSSCTITVTCSRGDFNETYDCIVSSSVTKEPGCETLGETTYTAIYNGLTSVVTIADIPAVDHVYRADTFTWYDENGRVWCFGGEQDEDFVWNENVTCKANLICTVCGKEFTADCIVTISDEYSENGLPVRVYTATVGDTGLYFTVTRDETNDRILGIETSDATASGTEVGDSSAEMANENHLGDVVDEYTTGELVMPDETVTGYDSNGGQIQTADFATILGIACIPIFIVWFTADRVIAHKRKQERKEKYKEIEEMYEE